MQTRGLWALLCPIAMAVIVTACGGGGGGGGSSGSNGVATVTEPPATLGYSATSSTYEVGQKITANTPTNNGGVIAEYTISPPLPTGLTIDAGTGVISGTPEQQQVQTGYVVRGSNRSGSATVQLWITIAPHVIAPTSVSYASSDIVYTTGVPTTTNRLSVGGGLPTWYSVIPDLPSGLAIDQSSGAISGTPTAAKAAADYKVTAGNSAGSASTVIHIEVRDAPTAPTSLSYMEPLVAYAAGTSIVPNKPVSTGGLITHYTVSPALPAGLTLDAGTGVISGTPTAAVAAATYTVTGGNAVGSKSVAVQITVITYRETFTAAASLSVARVGHIMMPLRNGKVLVAGGERGQYAGQELATAELFDPATGVWSSTGSLSKARSFNAGVLLMDGRVLVFGNNDGSGEIYDPASGNWSPTGSTMVPRSGCSVTLMQDGKVLAAGGVRYGTSDFLRSAELYDPNTGTWSDAGTMYESRYGHGAVLLQDGRVLISGGQSQTTGAVRDLYYPTTSELFYPQTRTWSSAGGTKEARVYHSMTLLRDGRVLVAGGAIGSGVRSSAEVYDSATRIWSVTGSMVQTRIDHSATLLPDGRVLVAGGVSGTGANLEIPAAELYDPAAGSWKSSATMVTPREQHKAALMPNGKVLITGGTGPSGPVSNVELFE